MRFVFPVVGSVIIALLFVNFYPPLRSPLRFSTIESDWPKVSHPNRLQILTPSPGPTPEITSPPVLAPAVQTQLAVEAEAATEIPVKVEPAAEAAPEMPLKVEPAAEAAHEVPVKIESPVRAARAQAPRNKKRFTSSEQLYRQPWSLDTDSFIKYLFFGRVN